MTHHRKRSPCQSCAKRLDNCSHLPFHTMPVHRHDGLDVVMICAEFIQAIGEVGKPFINPRRCRRL